jgi:hypothetical protein
MKEVNDESDFCKNVEMMIRSFKFDEKPNISPGFHFDNEIPFYSPYIQSGQQ